MRIHALKPWTELVSLHPDVESGTLAEAVFAIDLGAIAVGDKETPAVYREPDAFFAATYLTTDLRLMLEEVLASLAGQGSYNRVLKLRSPFGGGKSHTLASLLHAARSRKSLNQIPECKAFVDPGKVDVAVFDGEKFTATGDKDVGGGQRVHTVWGWLAWQIGPKAYKVVEKHDVERVSPAGDEIKAMLEDVMNSRWTSTDFQRTRGALRFLACCLHSLKTKGGAKPLLGPAEIPLANADVVRAMLKDLDPRQCSGWA